MPEETFEIVSLLMRYVFTALIVIICGLALRWLLHDHRVHARERRQLPRAGQIGVLESADTGERLPIAPEGLVGSGRICDVVIRRQGLRSRHFSYRLQPRRGVEIIPCGRAKVTVNDRPAKAGHYALSGALIKAGDAVFRLRLYKRLGLSQDTPSAESPDPLISAWDEEEFLPNGMAVPAAGTDEPLWGDDTPPDEDSDWGKVIPMFSDDPPDDREKP